MADHEASICNVAVGDVVRIRRSRRSPYSTHVGTVCSIDPDDRYGVYLVKFEDGLQFRYKLSELELIPAESKDKQLRPAG